MGMFQLFKKKEILTPLKVSDDAIVAMADGDGFEMLNHKQGDHVPAGDPIVRVNLKKTK